MNEEKPATGTHGRTGHDPGQDQLTLEGRLVTKSLLRQLAILMSDPMKVFHPMAQVGVEVMSRNRDVTEGLLADLRTAMWKRNVYRGHAISLAEDRIHELVFEGVTLTQSLLGFDSHDHAEDRDD